MEILALAGKRELLDEILKFSTLLLCATAEMFTFPLCAYLVSLQSGLLLNFSDEFI